MNEAPVKDDNIVKECVDQNYCNIQKVDKDQFGFTFKLLIETFKDNLDNEQDDPAKTIVPKSIRLVLGLALELRDAKYAKNGLIFE